MKISNVKLSNGVLMPVIGLGTWNLTGRKCEESVKEALNLGYTHIDTADFYGNHKEIGRAIKSFDRKKLFITTKVWNTDLEYDDVLSSCDRALKELNTDYIDLYLIHWPNSNIPLKNTFDALRKLYDDKKIRAVGVSNFNIRLLKESIKMSRVPITVNQVEFHPFLYQKSLLEFCRKNDIKITAYSPLARGRVFKDVIISEIARKHNKTAGQITLRWLLDKEMIAIPKASSRKHLEENIDVFNLKLSKEETELLDSLPKKRLIDPGFTDFDD